MQEIYFDNAATTQIDPLIEKELKALSGDKILGNASSYHLPGSRASRIIEKSRSVIASKINCDADEIIFTSCGSESNNLAIKGIFFENYPKKLHFISSMVEHPSVLKTLNYLERFGAEVTLLSVDSTGVVNTKELLSSIKDNTVLVSIMHANNETGVLQPIEKIGDICKKNKVLFHCDASQSFTKLNIDVDDQNIDLLTISGHKINGPKGVGALYKNKNVKLSAIIHGGDQENGLRSGSYNTLGIYGMGIATELSSNENIEKMSNCRKYLIDNLKSKLERVHINGEKATCICNIVSLRIERVNARKLFLELNENKIFVSTGSACTTNKTTPSDVLKAMGLTDKEAFESLRISFSKNNTYEEIDKFVDFLVKYIKTNNHE